MNGNNFSPNKLLFPTTMLFFVFVYKFDMSRDFKSSQRTIEFRFSEEKKEDKSIVSFFPCKNNEEEEEEEEEKDLKARFNFTRELNETRRMKKIKECQ